MIDNKPQARRGVPGEPFLEIRTKLIFTNPPPDYDNTPKWALYGVNSLGEEFDLTFFTAGGLITYLEGLLTRAEAAANYTMEDFQRYDRSL